MWQQPQSTAEGSDPRQNVGGVLQFSFQTHRPIRACAWGGGRWGHTHSLGMSTGVRNVHCTSSEGPTTPILAQCLGLRTNSSSPTESPQKQAPRKAEAGLWEQSRHWDTVSFCLDQSPHREAFQPIAPWRQALRGSPHCSVSPGFGDPEFVNLGLERLHCFVTPGQE